MEAGSVGHAAQYGNEIAGPAYITYSWGVLYTPNEGPQVAYTWEDLNRRNVSGIRN
jgi:hypothetical protein